MHLIRTFVRVAQTDESQTTQLLIDSLMEIRTHFTALLVPALLMFGICSPAVAQGPNNSGFQLRQNSNNNTQAGNALRPQAANTATATLGNNNPNAGSANHSGYLGGKNPNGQNSGQLPRDAGQEYRVYDLKPYTRYLKTMDHPEQAVVDWILRETGTDAWFGKPFGYLSADRDSLMVYHTREMHQVVQSIVERFVAGERDPQVLHIRLMTVGNPNWRARAHMLMEHVPVDAPGVQAWLLSKENAALVLNILRSRTDAREVEDVYLPMYNGQSEQLASVRGRNYVRNVRRTANGWPPYEPETGEVQEGYTLQISPLLTIDRKKIDFAIRAKIDQVDKFNHVNVELPLVNGQVHKTRLDVPQVVSWRLHERFRWPSDMVMLLSCGVVASPERGSGLPMFNMSGITGSSPGRADALMFIEHRGRATENLATVPVPIVSPTNLPPGASSTTPAIATRPGAFGELGGGINRGRY